MSRRPIFAILLLLFVAACIGAWWYSRRGAEGPPQLEAVAFADLPGWKESDPRAALSAFRRSCAKILAQDPRTPVAYGGVVGDWIIACAAAMNVRDPRAFFEANFRPFAIGQGLATGYYEPLLKGSRGRHDAYRTPVYGLPDDLVTVDLGLFRPEWKGEKIAGRIDERRLLPYPSRAQIDAKPPTKTRVLFYGDDSISVFFLHIQGSGRVRLDDGTTIRVNYAGQNGQPYTPIGHILIADYGLPREGMSMQVIRAWLKAHPSEERRVLESDASFVFFEEAPVGDATLGPPGSEGVPLTPRASIAVDPRFNPFGMPVFLSGDGIAALFVAQDTGGAIRGPARADIFYGFGTDAENTAGGMKAHPRFYLLLPRHASGGTQA